MFRHYRVILRGLVTYASISNAAVGINNSCVCEIIVHLLVIVQNKKSKKAYRDFCAINEVMPDCCEKIQQNHGGGEYLV